LLRERYSVVSRRNGFRTFPLSRFDNINPAFGGLIPSAATPHSLEFFARLMAGLRGLPQKLPSQQPFTPSQEKNHYLSVARHFTGLNIAED